MKIERVGESERRNGRTLLAAQLGERFECTKNGREWRMGKATKALSRTRNDVWVVALAMSPKATGTAILNGGFLGGKRSVQQSNRQTEFSIDHEPD